MKSYTPVVSVGTKSVLFGVHCFAIHPFFVARAWTKLYGFPWDPRLWAAFFLHDIGYFGRPNMDGPEGELHPELGARIMGWLFDRKSVRNLFCFDFEPESWHDFTLYHSRYYCKRAGAKPSRLCFADKLVPTIEPWWLYLPRAKASGEINEYLKNAQRSDSPNWKPTGFDKRRWYKQLGEYMANWVEKHRDGAEDTWISGSRNTKTESGV